MKRKTIAVWAAAAGGAICLTALSSAYAADQGASADDDRWLTAEETLAEFRQIGATSDLTLPEGVDWPRDAPPELNDKEALFEVGYADMIENMYWLCAWEDNLVATEGSKTRENALGLNALSSFPKSEWFLTADVDPEGLWKAKILEPALAGDLTGVKGDLASCDYFYGRQR